MHIFRCIINFDKRQKVSKYSYHLLIHNLRFAFFSGWIWSYSLRIKIRRTLRIHLFYCPYFLPEMTGTMKVTGRGPGRGGGEGMVLALKTPTEVGMLQTEVHQFYFSLSKCVCKVVEAGHLKHIKLIN